MLSTKIKANSITHLTDARYFAAWEAEWLGFQMTEGDAHYISLEHITAFKEWVDGVKLCGEFGLQSPEDIIEILDLLNMEAVQLNMFTPLATIKALKNKAEVLQEVIVENYSDSADLDTLFSENHPYVDYFILQCSKGGIRWSDIMNGTPFSLEKLKEWAQAYPILLDIDLDGAEDAAQLLELLPIKGYCLSGGAEEKTGLKSFDELDDFFELLELLV